MNASEALKSFNIRINDATYDNAGTGGYPGHADVLYEELQYSAIYDVITDQGTMNVTAAIPKTLLEGGTASKITVV
jgi:hypothetical protein